MHSLIRSQGLRSTVAQEIAPMISALVVAEVFYKFHSFLLETGAFLATWWLLSWLWSVAQAPRRTHDVIDPETEQ